MAGKQVNFELDVNANKAQQGLKEFARAVKQANKDAADSFDDTSTAADRAAQAISQMAHKMDAEMRDAASAADALSAALGPEVTGRMDVDQVVSDLNRMGLTFDEIRADADKLATALKDVDGVRLEQVNDGLDRTSTGTDKVARSAGGAHSVLANMIGNATQDLGALGGVAGSAGVAIGQMGEYMADAKLEGESFGSVVKNFSTIVGPVAALSAGVLVATKLWGNYQAAQAEIARQTDDVAKALIDLSGIVEQVNEDLAQQAEVGDFGDKLLDSLSLTDEKFVDILASANQLGIAFTDVGDIIAGFGAKGDIAGLNILVEDIQTRFGVTREQAEGIAAALGTAGTNFGLLRNELVNVGGINRQWVDDNKDILLLYGQIGQAAKDTDINESAKRYLATLKLTAEGLQQITDATQRLHDQGIINPSEIQVASEISRGATQAARSIDDLNRSTAESKQIAAATAQNWGILLADLADGSLDTQNAADAWNILQAALGLTDDAMQALVDTKLADKVTSDAEAADALAQKLADAAQQALDVADATDQITQALAETPDLAAAITDQFGKVNDILGGLEFDVNFQSSLDDALKGLHGFGPDLQTLADEWADILSGKDVTIFGNVRADDDEFQGKIQALTKVFQDGVTNAFGQGGVEAADTFVQSTAAQIAKSTGLSIQDVYKIMGLPPDGSIDTIIQPAVDEAAATKAAAILDALAGISEDPRIAQIKVALLTDDIDPEIAALAAQLLAADLGIGVKPVVNDTTTQEEIDRAQAYLDSHPATVATTTDGGAQTELAGVAAFPWMTSVDVTTPNLGQRETDIDKATEDRVTTVFVPKSDSLGQMKTLIDFVSRDRTTNLNAKADNAGAIGRILDAVARDRAAWYFAFVNEGSRQNADATLNNVARDRTAHIDVQTHNTVTTTTVGGGGAIPNVAPTATGLAAAPAAAAPSAVTMRAAPVAPPATFNFTINTGVMGNHFDVERSVARALRRMSRINGRRAVTGR